MKEYVWLKNAGSFLNQVLLFFNHSSHWYFLSHPSPIRLLWKKESLLVGAGDFADEHQHILHRREPFASTESLVQLLP